MLATLSEIVLNLSLLMSLALVLHLLRQARPERQQMGNVLLGVLLGGVAVFCMLTSYEFRPGIYLDARTIALALAGLFGGVPGALVATTMAVITRGLLGGAGLWNGLAVIVLGGLCGVAGRHFFLRSNWPPTPIQLWALGVAMHLLAFPLLFLLLPAPLQFDVMKNLAIPYLLVFPLVMALVGSIIARQEKWFSKLTRLSHAEWLFSESQKVTRFGSWEYRLSTDQLIATPHFYELLDLPAETRQLTLQDLFNRLHRDDWDPVRRAFDAALRDQSEIDIQGRLLTDSGRQMWIRLVGKPVAAKGKTSQLVGNLIDITRRMTIELDLRASEERLQGVIDHAPALVCLCDLDGKILRANRRFTLLGFSKGEVVGRPLYELLPRGGALGNWIDDLLALRAGEKIEFVESLSHADGTVHTYLTSKYLLPSPGELPDTICFIAADISELSRAKDNLQRLTAELTSKNDELERFSYTVSHDLKAPLLTIGSYATLLREDIDAGSTDQALQDLDQIQEAVGKMRKLIDELLSLSRSGQTTASFTDIDLNIAMADVLRLVDGEIRLAGAKISIAADLPTVKGNSAWVRQVLQNLVQNALKYRIPNQPVVIDINGTAVSDGSVQVTVKDNGRGIATEDQQRVFELFERIDYDSKGVGVGLSLARRIMRKHGGDIVLESAGAGAGCTFTLHFPAPVVKDDDHSRNEN